MKLILKSLRLCLLPRKQWNRIVAMSATALGRQYVDAQDVTGCQLYEEAEFKVFVFFVALTKFVNYFSILPAVLT